MRWVYYQFPLFTLGLVWRRNSLEMMKLFMTLLDSWRVLGNDGFPHIGWLGISGSSLQTVMHFAMTWCTYKYRQILVQCIWISNSYIFLLYLLTYLHRKKYPPFCYIFFNKFFVIFIFLWNWKRRPHGKIGFGPKYRFWVIDPFCSRSDRASFSVKKLGKNKWNTKILAIENWKCRKNI